MRQGDYDSPPTTNTSSFTFKASFSCTAWSSKSGGGTETRPCLSGQETVYLHLWPSIFPWVRICVYPHTHTHTCLTRGDFSSGGVQVRTCGVSCPKGGRGRRAAVFTPQCQWARLPPLQPELQEEPQEEAPRPRVSPSPPSWENKRNRLRKFPRMEAAARMTSEMAPPVLFLSPFQHFRPRKDEGVSESLEFSRKVRGHSCGLSKLKQVNLDQHI